jgi:hypothetical protein
MPHFILNKNHQSNGDYEVHNLTDGCDYMPNTQNRQELGYHLSCREAVAEAKGLYQNIKINGCYYCCRECHTS